MRLPPGTREVTMQPLDRRTFLGLACSVTVWSRASAQTPAPTQSPAQPPGQPPTPTVPWADAGAVLRGLLEAASGDWSRHSGPIRDGVQAAARDTSYLI